MVMLNIYGFTDPPPSPQSYYDHYSEIFPNLDPTSAEIILFLVFGFMSFVAILLSIRNFNSVRKSFVEAPRKFTNLSGMTIITIFAVSIPGFLITYQSFDNRISSLKSAAQEALEKYPPTPQVALAEMPPILSETRKSNQLNSRLQALPENMPDNSVSAIYKSQPVNGQPDIEELGRQFEEMNRENLRRSEIANLRMKVEDARAQAREARYEAETARIEANRQRLNEMFLEH